MTFNLLNPRWAGYSFRDGFAYGKVTLTLLPNSGGQVTIKPDTYDFDVPGDIYQGLSSQTGRPAKDARLVIGAVIIKHKLCLSDAETVQQIQENPYMQYFVGLPGYQMEAPFASSLFVDIRKRMGESGRVGNAFLPTVVQLQ